MHVPRILAGIAVTALASSALVSSANAGPSTDKGDLASQRASLSATQERDTADSSGTRFTTQAVACFNDPTGDTQPAGEPRADITTFCGANGADVSVSAQVAQPTDPSTDPNWSGLTGLIWSIDLDGDDEPEYDVYYLQGSVDVDDANGNTVCESTADFDGRAYSTTFPSSCIGSPAAFRLDAFMLYDSDVNDPEAELYGDITDFAGPVQRDGAAPPPSGGRSTGRLAGDDRFSTAVAISRESFAGGAPVVYLARSDAFADALAGGSLTRGPILLVPQCGTVPESVKAEVRRLGATEVVALGGPGAVCDAVLAQVASA